MSTTRKTITLTHQQNSWIKTQINAGKFTNDSEYIRDLIRRDQARSAERNFILAKLEASENSAKEHGWVDKSPEDMLDSFKEKARLNGKL